MMGSSSPRMRSSIGRCDRLGRAGGLPGFNRGTGWVLAFHGEEGVGERDGHDVRRIRVVADLRVDEEGDRQLRAFARLQLVLGEAEALDLVEVLAGVEG